MDGLEMKVELIKKQRDELIAALKKISAKSAEWQAETAVGVEREFPWWNLGDIANAALIGVGAHVRAYTTRMNVTHYWLTGSEDVPLCGKVLHGVLYDAWRQRNSTICPRCAERLEKQQKAAAAEVGN